MCVSLFELVSIFLKDMIEMLKYVFLLDIACLPTQVVTKLLVRNTLKNRNISALNYSTVECKYRRLMV